MSRVGWLDVLSLFSGSKSGTPKDNDKKNQNDGNASTTPNSKKRDEHIWGISDDPPIEVSLGPDECGPAEKGNFHSFMGDGEHCDLDSYDTEELYGLSNEVKDQCLPSSSSQPTISINRHEPSDNDDFICEASDSDRRNDYDAKEYQIHEQKEESFRSICSNRVSVSSISTPRSNLGERNQSMTSDNATTPQQLQNSCAIDDDGITAKYITNCNAHSSRPRSVDNYTMHCAWSNKDSTIRPKSTSEFGNVKINPSACCEPQTSNSVADCTDLHGKVRCSMDRKEQAKNMQCKEMQKPDQLNIHPVTDSNDLENCDETVSDKSSVNESDESCQKQKEAKILIDMGTDPHLETTSVMTQTDFEPYYSLALPTASPTVENENKSKSRKVRNQGSGIHSDPDSAAERNNDSNIMSIAKIQKPSVSPLRLFVGKSKIASMKRKPPEANEVPLRRSKRINKEKTKPTKTKA